MVGTVDVDPDRLAFAVEAQYYPGCCVTDDAYVPQPGASRLHPQTRWTPSRPRGSCCARPRARAGDARNALQVAAEVTPYVALTGPGPADPTVMASPLRMVVVMWEPDQLIR